MATLFYPGCQIKKDYPEASKKLAEYIQSKRPVEVVGCCRVDHGKSTQEDTALVVCNNCANIIAESGDPGSIEFVWEIIDNDPDFPFPDYHGEKMTIQDCWLAVEKRHVQDAIRSLMRKMNIQVVELPENHEKTTFCGMNLTAECNPSNAKLAPKRYGGGGGTHVPPPVPGGAPGLLHRLLQAVYHRQGGLLLQVLPGSPAGRRGGCPAHSAAALPGGMSGLQPHRTRKGPPRIRRSFFCRCRQVGRFWTGAGPDLQRGFPARSRAGDPGFL